MNNYGRRLGDAPIIGEQGPDEWEPVRFGFLLLDAPLAVLILFVWLVALPCCN